LPIVSKKEKVGRKEGFTYLGEPSCCVRKNLGKSTFGVQGKKENSLDDLTPCKKGPKTKKRFFPGWGGKKTQPKTKKGGRGLSLPVLT